MRIVAAAVVLVFAVFAAGIAPAGASPEDYARVLGCDVPDLNLDDAEGLKYSGSTGAWTEDCRFFAIADSFTESGELDPYMQQRGSSIRVYDALFEEMRVVASTDGKLLSGESGLVRVSDDGRFVTFFSGGSNLVPFGVNHAHYYQADVWTGTTQIVTLDEHGMQDDDGPFFYSQEFRVSRDGTYVSYHIRGDLLDVDPYANHVYRRNMRTGELVHVSRDDTNRIVLHGGLNPEMSDDGRFVAFISFGTWGEQNAYLKDLETGDLILLAADASGPLGGKSFGLELSADGQTASFSVASFQAGNTDYVWTATVGYAVPESNYVPTLPEPIGEIDRDSLGLGCGGGDLPYPEFARPLDDEVLRLYNAAFGRLPDAAGHLYWIGVRSASNSQLAVAAEFSISTEWELRYGASPTNEQIVDRFYANVLDRDPDPTGRAYWLGLIDDGEIGVPEMLVEFSDSQENIAKTGTSQVQTREDGAICRLYLVLLNKMPDNQALEYWRGQLLGGTTPREMATELMSSARHQLLYESGATATQLAFEVGSQVSNGEVESEASIRALMQKWMTRFERDRQDIPEMFVSMSQDEAVVAKTGTAPVN